MRQSISHVKHPDKHKCVMLCIEKEKNGFECIRPISKAYRYRKHYGHMVRVMDIKARYKNHFMKLCIGGECNE